MPPPAPAPLNSMLSGTQGLLPGFTTGCEETRGLILSPKHAGMRDYAFKFQKDQAYEKNAGQGFSLASQSSSLQRSLQISTDPRYEEIKHYDDGGWKAHFSNTMDASKKPKVDPTSLKDATKLDSGPSKTWDTIHVPESEDLVDAPGVMAGRCHWQDSFNLTVKRLMVDFDLSSTPSCRLNHLDRFHDWFEESGQKQARKARAEPNYVTISKNETVPAGSSRSGAARQPLSATSLILAGSMRMRKSPRLDVQEITPPMHPAAPPPPGVAPPRMGDASSSFITGGSTLPPSRSPRPTAGSSAQVMSARGWP